MSKKILLKKEWNQFLDVSDVNKEVSSHSVLLCFREEWPAHSETQVETH